MSLRSTHTGAMNAADAQVTDGLIYDWNLHGRAPSPHSTAVTLFDETLRDGIQSPSVVDPPIEVKKRYLHLLDALGVQHVDIGLPGAGPRAFEDVVALAEEIVRHRLRIKPAAAARTMAADIQPIIEASQRAGIAIEVMTFIGSSPIRALAESWDEALLARRSAEAVALAHRAGLPVTYVTEDTVRSRPETLELLFKAAIDQGAQRLCLCDTVGHATQAGVRALVTFTLELIGRLGADTRLDWHGHNDRGLALPNALVAFDAGADRIHGTMLGVGERVGNTSIDQLLVNYKLQGQWEPSLAVLSEAASLISEATHVPIALNYPVMGRDAFRTATGVHAAAVIKAARKGDAYLADRIYSGVPASMFGRIQEIEIGHMSGLSNVHYWLEQHAIPPREGVAEAILAAAKQHNRLLSEGEILEVISQQP